MSQIQSQSSSKSLIRSDEPLFESQDLICDSSQSNDLEIKSLKEVTNSQSSDRIGVRKSVEFGHYSRQMSQTLVNRTDHWKGFQVINYKTFKKVSQNSSQMSYKKEEVIPLKRVKVDSNKDLSLTQINDQMAEKPSDSEKSSKRKMDPKVETNPESSTKKKSRY